MEMYSYLARACCWIVITSFNKINKDFTALFHLQRAPSPLSTGNDITVYTYDLQAL
jgi:hypothetical protein